MPPSRRDAFHPSLQEQRFHRLLDALHDRAVCLIEVDGTIASWNAGAQRLHGYAEADAVGQSFAMLFQREDQASGVPGEVLARARDRGRHRHEGWLLRKNGSRFWAQTRIEPIRDDKGAIAGFAVVTRDLDLRDGRRAAEDTEQHFRLLVESVTDYAICLLDQNGMVSNWNAGAERILGYPSDVIVGSHFSRFYTGKSASPAFPQPRWKARRAMAATRARAGACATMAAVSGPRSP